MKYFLLALVLFNFALYPIEKKSIYVYKILTKNTKDTNFESKFRTKMTGILLKDFSEYNLMDDDSIAGLKAKLEKSKMFGCNEEACMREISRSLNADEVITGTIEENNGRFKYSFKNSSRVKKGEENLSIKSLADGEFYLNQWEYFTGEIVRKLMNPSYAMNYKDAPLYENLDDFNFTTVKDLKEIKLPEIKGNTLDIVKRLKEVTITDADTAYQKKDYLLALNGFRDARDALASLSPEDKKKAGNMATDIQNRIYMVGDAMFAKKLGELETYYKENSPMSLKATKLSKGLDGWLYLFTDYQKTLEEAERNPVTERRIAKRVVEIAGLRYNPEMETLYLEMENKSEELWSKGEYAEYIEYLKGKLTQLKDFQSRGGTRDMYVSTLTAKINQYKERIKKEEKILNEKISLYTDAFKAEESYNKKIQTETEKVFLVKKEIFGFDIPPETFTTKTGVKFTKIFRKDGKPFYLSERIRPDERDSWYFARDYAEKLNKEDNCPNCYRLPYKEEIEEARISSYDWFWFQSWSLAPVGMTLGNIFPPGSYTLDFVHDIVFHPLTWQSYLYPISPDSYTRDLSPRDFRSSGRNFTSKSRPYGGRDNDTGFNLVRPLREESVEEYFCKMNKKIFYREKCLNSEEELKTYLLSIKLKENWSDKYYTNYNLNSARELCKSEGKYLPSLNDLKNAQKEGLMKDWSDGYYWSSEERVVYDVWGNLAKNYGGYYLLDKNGKEVGDDPNQKYNVRCKR